MFLSVSTERSPYVHPDDHEKLRELRQAALSAEQDVFDTEYRMRHRDGRWIWIAQRSRVIERDHARLPTRVVGIRTDITGRRQAEDAARQLEREIAEAEMKALRYRVDPHFLFNTLNGIVSLVEDEPKRAEGMLILLSRFYRTSLEYASQKTVTLSEEVSLLNKYVAIEKMRFEDRLLVEFDIELKCLHAAIPPMILQPLVENSIKYGLSSSGEALLVTISARVVDDALEIDVVDNGGLPAAASAAGTGAGLSVTEMRLKREHPSRASVTAGRCGAGFRVELRLPFIAAANENAAGVAA
jgi:LytS/YehU family sensor histidine kinase